MKTNDRYYRDAAQDLCNAVVVQAADDFREYSSRLMVNPNDWAAKKELEEVKSFFLSPWFGRFTTAPGTFILRKLIAEQEQVKADCAMWQETKTEM